MTLPSTSRSQDLAEPGVEARKEDRTAEDRLRTAIPAVVTPFRAMELAEILRIANVRTPALPWIDGFEIASARDTADLRLFETQIRAIPRTEPFRPEFRYHLPLSESGRDPFADRAWDMLNAAHEFYAARRHSDLGERARGVVDPIIRSFGGSTNPPRLKAVGVAFDYMKREPSVTADIEMLGHDLRIGIERITAEDVAPLERRALRSMQAHVRRRRALTACVAAGASGWIDQTAVNILNAAGIDVHGAIRSVRQEGWLSIAIDDRDNGRLDATLIQIDGRIEGWIVPTSGKWCIKHGELTFRGAGLPETIRDSLIGRRVGAVFANAQLFREAIIEDVGRPAFVDPDVFEDDEVDGLLCLRLGIARAYIETVSGAVRGPWLTTEPIHWS